ncbi:MAG: glycosyltransferase family 39 protein, partial [Chloroflexi bacterium]|nr:glycosyltransferase family 39 protein [Chloroflexota bacterium]
DGKGFLGSFQSWVRHPDSPYLKDLPQYPGAYQPPAYVVFLAAVLGVTGRSVLAAKAAQVVLSGLTVLLVYAIGRSWFDRRRGLIAAGICALYPNLIAFSHYLWTETFFIFVFLLAVWLLTRRDRLPTTGQCLIGGLLLGIDLVSDGQEKTQFKADDKVGEHLTKAFHDRGLILRAAASAITFGPPLCITKDEVDEVVQGVDESIAQVTAEMNL